MLAINQDAAGIQARKVIVDGRPLGMPVGVEACTAPDQASLAASAACSSGTASTPPPQSMAEVAAAKQLWQSIPVGGSGGAVQLRSRFYSAAAPCREDGEAGEGAAGAAAAGAAGRCLALQRPNPCVLLCQLGGMQCVSTSLVGR